MELPDIRDLLQRYQTGNINQSEKELVEAWYSQLVETGDWQWEEGEKASLQAILEARIMNEVDGTAESTQPKSYSLFRNRWWAAAASIFLMGGLIYFLVPNKQTQPTPPIQTSRKTNDDVTAPQSNKAMITLANGQQVYIESIANGELATQGNVQLVKLPNGEIQYQATAAQTSQQTGYNTLSNPKGSKVINMVLTDGTAVWLNAGSSVTYPVRFVEKERKVSITGEAYFEVAKNAAMPFRVSGAGMEVQVLGTHFNMNTYSDESEATTTLLEGSVKVSKNDNTVLLKPGEQAGINNIAGNIAIKQVDVDKTVAWKNGLFQFDGDGIDNIMRQVSRWYDIDVRYEGKKPQGHFSGIIDRNISLSKFLYMLRLNEVEFEVEGKMLFIKSR